MISTRVFHKLPPVLGSTNGSACVTTRTLHRGSQAYSCGLDISVHNSRCSYYERNFSSSPQFSSAIFKNSRLFSNASSPLAVRGSGLLNWPQNISLKSSLNAFSTSFILNCDGKNASDPKATPKTSFLKGLSKLEGTNIESLDLASKTSEKSDESQKQNYQESEEEQKKKQDEAKKSMRTLKISFTVLGVMLSGLAGYIVAVWGLPEQGPDGNLKKDEFSEIPVPFQYFARAWGSVRNYAQSIKDPSSDKLLPDPLKEPYYQPPYTVVLELTGVLVHPDWTYQTGWRFKKRPGIDFFLSQTGPPVYEIVVYTQENALTAYPIVDALDPKGYIMYKLFRDSTKYVDGHHMKELDSLNRDLSKVIVVDWNDKALANHPRNLLRLKKWKGEDEDRSLFDLALLLRAIAASQVPDVRDVLDYYRQFDDPLEAFRENQRKLQEAEEERLREQQAAKPKWTPSIFGRRFG